MTLFDRFKSALETYYDFATKIISAPYRRNTSDGTIPEWLKNPEWNDEGGKQIPENPPPQYNTEFETVNNFINNVYYSPTIIFSNDDFTGDGTGSDRNLPEPDEILNQTPTSVSIGAPITLEQSIIDRNFGQLLHNPFSGKIQTIRQVNTENYEEDLKTLAQTGLDNYAAFLAGDANSNILDSIILISPEVLKGHSGNTGLSFGLDYLKTLAAYCSATANNAFIGIADTIPNSYVIETYEPEIIPAIDNMDGLTIASALEEKSESADVVSLVASDRFINQISGKVLVLHFVTFDNYPKRKRNSSYREVQIPAPKETFTWETDFDSLRWYQGNQYAELRFQENYVPVSGWFKDEASANSYFDAVLTLTTATEDNRIIPKHSNPKTAIPERETRPYRAFIESVNSQGQAVCEVKYTPPNTNESA